MHIHGAVILELVPGKPTYKRNTQTPGESREPDCIPRTGTYLGHTDIAWQQRRIVDFAVFLSNEKQQATG